MTILLLLIPIGIGLLIAAISAFVWAVRSGQFDDLEGEGERILFDDEPLARHDHLDISDSWKDMK